MSCKVFISYSHDSEEHREQVRGLHASLSRDGCDCPLDLYKDTGEDWPAWMTRQLIEADFILCVVTEIYDRRFRDQELPNQGLGFGWEAGLIRRLLYAKKLHNDRIFPVIFAKAESVHIPLELQGYDHFLLDGPAGYEALLRKVLKRPLYALPAIGVQPLLATMPAQPLFARPGEGSSSFRAATIRADISRIIKYGPADLIGRDAELSLLTTAWEKVEHGEKGRLRVLTFVALGGEGKTSLVAKWVAELSAQDWPGGDAVFAWSFYSQGTKDQVAASSDLFLKEALLFFGDDEDKTFAASPAGAYEKGQRLARIVGQRRSLLILDGLEPLQYAPTSPTPGELKDQGIAALLKGLAANSQGLCVVTSRYSIPDLKAFRQTTAREEKLLRLSCEAGVHLLKTLGVKGTAKEFERLVEDVKGHALTLTLLGGFLKRAFHGDIRQRDRVKFEKADEKMDGGHAFRTMAAYEQWLLRDGGDEGRREVAVLRLMGLFDRPADAGDLAALRSETIPGLSEPLAGLADDDWEFCLSGLETAKLLTVNRDSSGAIVSLDAHPHLREYFARQLRTQHPNAWRAAHRLLYEHLCVTTEDKDEPTLEDLQPLYQAVAHGCQAGLQKEARKKVFLDRIRKRYKKVSIYMLGAFSSDLGAIACFFEAPWDCILKGFNEAEQAWILSEASYCLVALGRLTEAVIPVRTALAKGIQQLNWESSAVRASRLSQLNLLLGELDSAIDYAEQAVEHADRSGKTFHQLHHRVRLAENLHQSGRRVESAAWFGAAEELQAKRQPDFPQLISVCNFRYGELLLDSPEKAAWRCTIRSAMPSERLELDGACRTVAERTARIFEWRKLPNWKREFDSLLDVALDHLILGRASLYEAILTDPYNFQRPGIDPDRIAGLLVDQGDGAVSSLRVTGQVDETPKALLTRAWLRFLSGAGTGPDSAHEDLEEAWEIAERGLMKLHMADIHLYRARLFFREREYPKAWISPQADLAAAEKLINECGYHRRDEELADAKRAILGVG